MNTYFERFTLNLPRRVALECSAPGRDAEPYIAEAMRAPALRKQLDALDPAALRAELAEYGAWDGKELADHDANLARIVWLASSNIREGR